MNLERSHSPQRREFEVTSERQQRRTSTESEVSSIRSFDNEKYIGSSSTPLRNTTERSKKVLQKFQEVIDVIDDVRDESSESKQQEESSFTKKRRRKRERGARDSPKDEHDLSVSRKRKKKHARQPAGQRRSDRFHRTSEDRKERSVRRSSIEQRGEGDTEFRKQTQTAQDRDELPITEILRQSQGDARNRHEELVPLPELTTDTIYIQRRNGFSAVKINERKNIGKQSNREGRIYPPIRAAIAAQTFFKSVGLIYQGLLGGMAFIHFIMIQLFFDASIEFINDYSSFSEIYTNIFSLLIILSVIAILDKFDIARLDMNHLREIYENRAISIIAFPVYIAVFCLHQATSKTDNELALTHYQSFNNTIWYNITKDEIFDELETWRRLTLSKDILAVLAWHCIFLGGRDEDMLLTYLKSMEKYTSSNSYN